MDEQSDDDNVRALFTQVGCIMEDASTTALIWHRAAAVTVDDRYQQLLLASRQIDAALKNIKCIIDGS